MKKTIIILIAALVGGLLPMPGAKAAPAIQLLNPSTYNGAVPEVSTKADTDGNYHFVAWVPSLPANPIVEFEVQTAAGNAVVTIDSQKVGADTFEGFDPLTNVADGSYFVVARLYSNGVEVEEGTDSQAITIRNGLLSQSETAEILHPSNGGSLGFYTPPDLAPRAIVDVATSEDALQARVFVTTSDPGAEPTWVLCGSGAVSGGVARVRCTLPSDVRPGDVTAVAATANQTPPPGPAAAPADDSGDAHRVTTYTAVPTQVTVAPEASTAEVDSCKELTATVLDQLSRPLQAVNVDVHAIGPTDQLQFATGGNAQAFQAPDAGPHSSENAHQCNDLAPERRQGETNRIGAPDEKHIESMPDNGTSSGTNNSGMFTFALYSNTQGGTHVIAWADHNDDDIQQPAEASGGARVGWGQDPPAPVKQIFLEPSSGSATVGSCQRMVLTIKEGGSPASGRNADVHMSSTGTTPAFCAPSDATATRAPDQGEHVGGSHADGTQHIEGELDALGRMIFGVSAPTEGQVLLQGWLDEGDDDVQSSSEEARSASVDFVISGDRDVSLSANRNRVKKGRRVRLSGGIDGADACSERQVVKLRAKVPGKRFKTIAKKRTNDEGNFTFRPKVFRTKIYKAIAPRNGVCDKAASRNVRVRAKR